MPKFNKVHTDEEDGVGEITDRKDLGYAPCSRGELISCKKEELKWIEGKGLTDGTTKLSLHLREEKLSIAGQDMTGV